MKPIKHLIKFINNHPNWEEIISSKPYSTRHKRHPEFQNLVMFHYKTNNIDFSSHPFRLATRGTILEIVDNKVCRVICHAFDKFFNYGEYSCATIDFNTSYFSDKIDGSFIRLYFNPYSDKWQFATNKGFDDCGEVTSFNPQVTFRNLISKALQNININYENLPKNHTFFFELVSPENQVIIYYPETKMYLLGARNNDSDKEFLSDFINKKYFAGQFETLKRTAFGDLEEVRDLVNSLKEDKEGFVLCDARFNRIKMKGEAYLSLHKLRDNNFTIEKLYNAIMLSRADDIRAYFPQYIGYIEQLENQINMLQEKLKFIIILSVEQIKFYYAALITNERTLKRYFANWMETNFSEELHYFCFKIFRNFFKENPIEFSEIIDDYIKKLNYENFLMLSNVTLMFPAFVQP